LEELPVCGRFALVSSARDWVTELKLDHVLDLQPRYNIAPSQQVAVVVSPDGQSREMRWMGWGLIPSWAKDPKIGYKLINARGETVAEKPSFRAAFKRRRCLVLADGFYEWQPTGGKRKQPYYIYSDRLLTFAGLWEEWQAAEGEPIQTCTIITTTANELMQPIHDRMPVILSGSDRAIWLDPTATPQTLQSILVPCDSAVLTAYPVSTLVNSPQNDRADCIEPLVS
jgi:putative SOS response-associated peptidase YedK